MSQYLLFYSIDSTSKFIHNLLFYALHHNFIHEMLSFYARYNNYCSYKDNILASVLEGKIYF